MSVMKSVPPDDATSYPNKPTWILTSFWFNEKNNWNKVIETGQRAWTKSLQYEPLGTRVRLLHAKNFFADMMREHMMNGADDVKNLVMNELLHWTLTQVQWEPLAHFCMISTVEDYRQQYNELRKTSEQRNDGN